MSQIHFIGGKKGGVGKSVLARLLAQYLIDRELPFRAYEQFDAAGAALFVRWVTPAEHAAPEVPGAGPA